ncbi:sugar kinases, ribokinase family [Cenarchaeum symbiosum A]|uniref:Sugar kinases, ribokinase family n=1 Tax=Cenarchaeum symbiosum (strain A) TaxID=414004 RepID=A0RXI9_CENSY|nr:sugar kinases, ribokinase family [Cenarchaeum symbiosum A]
MLTVFGSTALDTIRTPARTLQDALGGAAVYAGISASFFVDAGLVAVVGGDFPRRHRRTLAEYLDLRGLSTGNGRTFRYDGKYDETLSTRRTLKTELNVLEGFRPVVPEEYRDSRFVYLANNDPVQNVSILEQFDRVKFSMCDTIDFWISTKREAVRKMIRSVDAVVINDEEAKLLTKEHNLVRCAKKMMKWGATYVIIKKGEHGSLMFYDDVIFHSPGFSLGDVVDPTGAGDSFAGAMIGKLAAGGSASLSSVKKAVVQGNVMGSFAVEGYGLSRLLRLKKRDIAARMRAYEKMARF